MGSILSGSQTTKVKQPEYIVEAAKDAIARANEIGQMGYMPYYGPTVASFSPAQEAAFQNTNNAAGAFGLLAPSGTGMPAPMNVGGFSGYSEIPIFEMAMQELQRRNPDRHRKLVDFYNGTSQPSQPGQSTGGLFAGRY